MIGNILNATEHVLSLSVANIGKSYCCPAPTPEQIALSKEIGTDGHDRCGSGIFSTSPCDPLCSACLIHDEKYMIGGDSATLTIVNANFRRDALILAHALPDPIARELCVLKARFFADLVDVVGSEFWTAHNRNTPVTQAQGAAFMLGAQAWVNSRAKLINSPLPYPI